MYVGGSQRIKITFRATSNDNRTRNRQRKGRQVKSSKKDLEELKNKVALGNRIMFHQGLADYHGHVSARIPGTRKFFIKPVLAPLGEIKGKDVILVDIDEYMEVCEQNYAKAGNQRAVTKLKN